MKHPKAEQFSKVIVLIFFVCVTSGMAIAMILASAISPETILTLLGALVILSLITFAMTFAFRPVEGFLKMIPEYPWFQAPRLPPNRRNDRIPALIVKTLAGASFQLTAYWTYVTILAIFFFGLGDPFASNPAYLLWATFSGAVIVRLSRYIPEWAERIATLIADFLVPFGVILGLAVWIRLGASITSPQILGILAVYGPLIFMLFPLYLISDAAFQLLKDRGWLSPDSDQSRSVYDEWF